MITKSTVLVLGAGASVHCDYPLGSQLVSALCHPGGLGSWLPKSFSQDDVDDFRLRLSRSAYPSIDAFLEANLDFATIGKYLIALQLKKRENLNRLFPPHNSGWYRYLFDALLTQEADSKFCPDNIGIITFNYDRSLEAYLHNILQYRFKLESTEAMSLLARIPIIHIYGMLGAYPEVPYKAASNPEELEAISKQIQIIHELPKESKGFCSETFHKAHQLLVAAQRIFFLGFAFHPENLARFRFFTPEHTDGKMLRSTHQDLYPTERQKLLNRLASFGFTDNLLKHDGTSCETFFRAGVSLN